MTSTITPATPADLPAIEQLLTACALPLAGVRDQFPEAFAVVREGATLAAVAALERHRDACLLRSVAVADRYRRRGLAGALVRERLQHADGLPVYLLTTTAAPYFARLGFSEVPRASAPESLGRSPEFTGACPASATCLRWTATAPPL